jgi:hypothetical protein
VSVQVAQYFHFVNLRGVMKYVPLKGKTSFLTVLRNINVPRDDDRDDNDCNEYELSHR